MNERRITRQQFRAAMEILGVPLTCVRVELRGWDPEREGLPRVEGVSWVLKLTEPFLTPDGYHGTRVTNVPVSTSDQCPECGKWGYHEDACLAMGRRL